MKTSLIFSLLIWAVLLFGLYGAGQLSWNNFQDPEGICPKLLSIPACYIILLFLLTAGVSHLLDYNPTYWLATGLAAGIAVAGTVGELTGTSSCPQTASGTPMCFISLAMFAGLILLKMLAVRTA